MAIKFNPLTGNFDFTGSGGGGGGSAFFAGEVATYADLPLDGTAALDSRWLVRSNSGTWPFSSYKQAGVYVRKATVGASRDNDYQLTDTTFFDVMSDDKFLVFDNSDATKAMAFNVGANVPTSSTVTLTVPAASGTIARTETFAAPPAIGNTTAAAGSFTTLSASDALTASNATASPPSTLTAAKGVQWSLPASSSAAIAGIYPGSPAISLLTGSPGGMSELARFSSSGIAFNSPLTLNGTGAAELVNAGAAAGPLRIYNTFTSATNHERGFLRWSSNVFQIGTEKGSGGGTARALALQTDGTTRMTVGTDGFVGIGVTAERPLHIQGTAAVGRIDRVGVFGPAWMMTRIDASVLQSSWLFGPATGFASVTNDDFAIIDYGTATTGTGGTARLTISKSTGQLTVNGNLNLSTKDLVTDTATGTKIGTGTTQKIGFFNATPVGQQAAVADATDAASTQARLNDLLARLRTLGLIAT